MHIFWHKPKGFQTRMSMKSSHDSLRLFTVKATPKLPALYITKDWAIYMGMDTSATGVHKNLSSLTLEPCELLRFNIGEIQCSGPLLGFSTWIFPLSNHWKVSIVV